MKSLYTTPPRVAVALTFWLVAAAAVPAQAQDQLTRAKTFYASADYEEALQVLEKLRGTAASTEATEVAAYQVFCLLALGRSAEARQAIENIVRIDPLFHPSENQVSPRVRGFFEDVRRPLLPDVARQLYGRAKEAFDRKEMPVATSEFDRVIALLDEMANAGDEGVSDLRTLAAGFRDLAKAAIPPPPPPAPPPAPTPPPAPIVALPPAAVEPVVYSTGDLDVSKPIAINRDMPTWRPNAVQERQAFSGAVELVIGEDGSVLSVALRKSVHPSYDPDLIKAAATWTFKPAMRNGKPVRYRFLLGIQVGR
jgi:tetratricopeptide (TPR) repeat protein